MDIDGSCLHALGSGITSWPLFPFFFVVKRTSPAASESLVARTCPIADSRTTGNTRQPQLLGVGEVCDLSSCVQAPTAFIQQR